MNGSIRQLADSHKLQEKDLQTNPVNPHLPD